MKATIEELMKTLEDHERRITLLEMKSNANKVLDDPNLKKAVELLVKGVNEQNARTRK